MKLSIPQQKLLAELYRSPHGVKVVDYYPPAKVLVRFGLAEWRQAANDYRLHATPAGIAEHEAQSGGPVA